MSAFYKSISLDQIIHVDKINELTPDQQTVLRDELRIAVDEMNFMERRVKKEATIAMICWSQPLPPAGPCVYQSE